MPSIFSMIDVFRTIERYEVFYNDFFGKAYDKWPSTVPPEISEEKMCVSPDTTIFIYTRPDMTLCEHGTMCTL